VQALKAGLEEFLMRRVYQHSRVQRMTAKGQRIVRALFEEFHGRPGMMPERYSRLAQMGSVPRVVCDYIAGMTDRYAQDEYLRLFHPFTSL
jgi:dGTPase